MNANKLVQIWFGLAIAFGASLAVAEGVSVRTLDQQVGLSCWGQKDALSNGNSMIELMMMHPILSGETIYSLEYKADNGLSADYLLASNFIAPILTQTLKKMVDANSCYTASWYDFRVGQISEVVSDAIGSVFGESVKLDYAEGHSANNPSEKVSNYLTCMKVQPDSYGGFNFSLANALDQQIQANGGGTPVLGENIEGSVAIAAIYFGKDTVASDCSNLEKVNSDLINRLKSTNAQIISAVKGLGL